MLYSSTLFTVCVLLSLSTSVSASFEAVNLLSNIKAERSEYDVPQGGHRRHHARHLRRRKCKSSNSTSTASTDSGANTGISLTTSIKVGDSDSGAASNSSTSNSSTSTTSSTSSYGRALAWAMDDNLADLFVNSAIKETYHWEHGPVAGLTKQAFFPMYWGTSKRDMFLNVMKGYSDDNLPEWIIGFNEPDLPMQGNMSPEEAAQQWKQYIQPYASKGVKLAAPQLSWDHQWYTSFFAACDGCTFDAIGMHWYGDVNKFDDFKTAVDSFWSTFKQHAPEMWITEYSVTASSVNQSGASASKVLDFAKQTTAYLESLDYVTLKAWFGAWSANPDGYASSLGRFVDDSNQLTEIGQWWTS